MGAALPGAEAPFVSDDPGRGGDPAARRRGKAPLGAAFEPALQLAYDQIARRARSEAEVRRRLIRAGSDLEVIDRVIARLMELRYLDDASFARARARGLASRGFGPRAVAFKLAGAGVGKEVAAGSIEEAYGDTEVSLARAALERRLRGRSFRSLEPKERDRLLRWLASRGFSARAIYGAGAIDPDPGAV